jgi:hypothetical protein
MGVATSRSEEGTASILFLSFEHDSNVFLRQNMKANLPVLLYDTPGMSAMCEQQMFRELFNSDILLKFLLLEFMLKRLHGLRIGGRVTQPSGTCGKEKNSCSLLESKPGHQKRTYKFTNRAILDGNNIRVKCSSFWDNKFEGHITNLTVI